MRLSKILTKLAEYQLRPQIPKYAKEVYQTIHHALKTLSEPSQTHRQPMQHLEGVVEKQGRIIEQLQVRVGELSTQVREDRSGWEQRAWRIERQVEEVVWRVEEVSARKCQRRERLEWQARILAQVDQKLDRQELTAIQSTNKSLLQQYLKACTSISTTYQSRPQLPTPSPTTPPPNIHALITQQCEEIQAALENRLRGHLDDTIIRLQGVVERRISGKLDIDQFEAVGREERAREKKWRDGWPARWVGRGMKGSLLPLQSELSNPDPNNYTWSPSSTTILVQKPGLYNVLIYTYSTPIALLINSQQYDPGSLYLKGRCRLSMGGKGKAVLEISYICQ